MRAFTHRSVSPPARAMTDTVLPKTQSTSPWAARFRRYPPRWSALWAQHRRQTQPRHQHSGGIALHEGPTRRRHAVRGLHVVQNPHQCRDIERVSRAGRKTHTPQRPSQTNLARNFSLSLFERAQKRCNSSDLLSRLEAPPGELRAKLPEPMNVAGNNDYSQCIATTFPHRSS